MAFVNDITDKKKNTRWSPMAEKLLCEFWKQKSQQLRGTSHNNNIFNEIATEMGNRFFTFSSEEVHMKVNSLTSKYRKEKANMIESGQWHSAWPLYSLVREILEPGNNGIVVEEFIVEDSLDYLDSDFEALLPQTISMKMDYVYTPSAEEISRDTPSPKILPVKLPVKLPTSSTGLNKRETVQIDISRDTPSPKKLPVKLPVKLPTSSTGLNKREAMPIDISRDTPSPKRLPLETSTSSTGLNKRETMQIDILRELKYANEQMKNQMQEDRENTQQLLKLEVQRNNMLREFITDAREFQTSLLDILQTKKN